MEFLWNLASFIIALGVLVTIHEYGHFFVARKLGVKVLVFSVGFGKPILQKIGKDGVRYIISAIPLGGYVKMLGEQQDDGEELSEEDKKVAFNRQSVWTRMAIVLAGPVANFLLAIFLYWIIFLNGVTGLLPVLAEPEKDSIAAVAGIKQGDQIISVDGIETGYFQDVSLGLAKRIGESTSIEFGIKPKDSSHIKSIKLDISQWQVDEKKPDVLKSLGIQHILDISLIASVTKDSAADKAGVFAGDRVISIDGNNAKTWSEMSSLLAKSPEQQVILEVLRNDELISIPVVLGSREDNGKLVGVLGVSAEASKYLVAREAGLVEALKMAFSETVRMIELTVRLFKKFLFGDISHKSLSGPLSIAEGAGNSASVGIITFLGFLAVISVNLGFINLLPIPMLDGGHFLYFVIEAIRGKPLSEEIQSIGLQMGMLLVFALMAVAIFNDISRFSFS